MRVNELDAVVDKFILPCLPQSAAEPVLVVGDLGADVVRCISDSYPAAKCDLKTGDEILTAAAPAAKLSLALVVHKFGGPAGGETDLIVGKNVLSRVRDVFAERVLHAVINEATADQPNWLLADSLAMGFVKLGSMQSVAGSMAVYDFNICDYKFEPEWLNARHWAHPERW